jgi:hypothetical protein
MNLPFKDNTSAFEYACKYLECEVAEGAMLPAIVQDGKALFGTPASVSAATDGTQPPPSRWRAKMAAS